MTRLIIASAAAFETDESLQVLSKTDLEITRIVTGIGMTQSALISARTMDLVAGRHVVFCGTGGIVGNFSGTGLYSAQEIQLGPMDVRQGHCELLSDFDYSISLRPIELQLNTCNIVCSVGVTVGLEDNVLMRQKFTNKSSSIIETIELYAVARAWLPVVRSFTAIIAVTNATGPNARTDWRNNFRYAATMTASFLADKVQRFDDGEEYNV